MAITIKNLAHGFLAANTNEQTIYTAPTTTPAKAAVVSSIVLFTSVGASSVGDLTIRVKSGSTVAIVHYAPKNAGTRMVHVNQVTLAPGEMILAKASSTPGSGTEISYLVSGVERDV